MDTETEFKAAFEAGMLQGNPRTVVEGGVPFLLLPTGANVQDLEKFLGQPKRTRQVVNFTEAESFVRYVKEHREEATVIFAAVSDSGAAFVAVLDYHGAGKPSWCGHVANYTCPVTTEWKRWREWNNKAFTQEQFAEFVENNVLDIVEPPGAEMLEVASTLMAKKQVDFVSGVKLPNGNHQFRYEEVTKAVAGEKGQIEVPEKFKLGVPVFQGGPRYGVSARLRYRMPEGKLSFFYQIENPHLAVRQAGEAVLALVQSGTGLTPYSASI